MKKNYLIFFLIFLILLVNPASTSLLDQFRKDYTDIESELSETFSKINNQQTRLNSISQQIFKLKKSNDLGMIQEIQLNSLLRSSHDIVIKIKSLQKTRDTLIFLKKSSYLDYLSKLENEIINLLNKPPNKKNITSLISINNEKDKLIEENEKYLHSLEFDKDEIDKYMINKKDSVEDIMIKLDVIKDYEIELERISQIKTRRLQFLNKEIDLNLKILSYFEKGLDEYNSLKKIFKNKIKLLKNERAKILILFEKTEKALFKVRSIKEDLNMYVRANKLPNN